MIPNHQRNRTHFLALRKQTNHASSYNSTKKKLFEEYQKRKVGKENATKSALESSANEKFRLDRVLNQSSISLIINQGPNLLN